MNNDYIRVIDNIRAKMNEEVSKLEKLTAEYLSIFKKNYIAYNQRMNSNTPKDVGYLITSIIMDVKK